MAPVVVSILERRLHAADAADLTGPWRERLERLVSATEGRHSTVTDLARDVHFQMFEEPAIEKVVEENTAEMAGHLAALAADPGTPDRADRINRLVWSPQPMRSLLLDSWRGSLAADGDSEKGRAVRSAILEVYLRRFYRIRDLRGFDVATVDGFEFAFARYVHNDTQFHVD